MNRDDLAEDLHWLRDEADFCKRMICQKMIIQEEIDKEMDELQDRLELVLISISRVESKLVEKINENN